MAEPRGVLRRPEVAGLGLVVAVAGFLFGACGGGDGSALTTRTGGTATRPAATATRPEVTIPTRPTPTVPTPTVPTPTVPSPGTTVESPVETTPTVTVIETETEVETETEIETETETEAETTEPAPTEATTTEAEPPTETSAAAEPASESDTPWGWIALAAALLLGLVIGLLVWRRRRSAAASWSGRLADLSRRALVALDAVLAEGSVVTGQIQALAAEARSLETRAPDDPSRAAAGRVRASLDELAGTLEVDRNLRLGSPPPSPEQLSYSTALIRRQVESLQSVLRPTSPAPPA